MSSAAATSPRSGGMAGRHLRALDPPECLVRLRRHYLGRVAFVDGTAVRILPMNFVLHDGEVVLRLGHGAALDALAGSTVAFEVDEIDFERHAGWSVVVSGRAEQVTAPDERERLRALPLRPWAPGDRDHFVRIIPSAVTGRELT